MSPREQIAKLEQVFAPAPVPSGTMALLDESNLPLTARNDERIVAPVPRIACAVVLLGFLTGCIHKQLTGHYERMSDGSLTCYLDVGNVQHSRRDKAQPGPTQIFCEVPAVNNDPPSGRKLVKLQ